MNERSSRNIRFGDAPPQPPVRTKAPNAVRVIPRLAYALKAQLLKISHPAPAAPMIPAPDQVKRLLAIQLEHLGDLVLTEPTLRALRMHYPDAERVLIAPPFATNLFAGTGWGKILPPEALQDVADRKLGFDLAVDLTGRVEYRIAKMLARSGIETTIGYDRAGRGVYHTIPLPFPEITVPMREIYIGLAKALGATASDSIPRLPHGDDRLRRGRELWRERRIQAPVVIHPGAHLREQRWSIGGFTNLGRALKKHGVEVAVLCGPSEKGFSAAIAQCIEAPLVVGPSMMDLMDLVATSRVLVCNNTGPLHLAAALGVPTVSTMGPAIPWRWWPVSEAPQIVFRAGSQGAIADMELLDPLEMAAAVLHLLD